MKRLYTFLLTLIILVGFDYSLRAQSLTVSGTFFVSTDSISFTYGSPDHDTADWIGIYRVADAPGGPPSLEWRYIPADSGTINIAAPNETGEFKAFLLCCDGYDTIAISEVFRVMVPLLTSSKSSYFPGDSMVFSYLSPRFSETDLIGIYPAGTKPGSENESIDWAYIPDSSGTMTFMTDLDPGLYDAYLLCCDGYDSLAAVTFEVIDPDIPFVSPAMPTFGAGTQIILKYNDPDFAEDDWIGVYFEGDDPSLVSSVVWTTVTSDTGRVTFPGTLAGGSYFAVLFCCGASETEYARSDVFTVLAGASGTYIKTSASVYPESAKVLVNYRDADLEENDWIGIYKKGESPGGPESTLWSYVTADSGTVEFSDPLAVGEYDVYLLCCDGYNIKAKSGFKIADASTPSLVASAIIYATTDSLVFYYNSPDYSDLDWIGIYNPGDVPGDINSITWFYLPASSGTMVFHYPVDHSLEPGEYWAGLFCCDGYDLYAQTSFIISDEMATGIKPEKTADKLTLFPNPTDGHVTIRTDGKEGINRLILRDMTGKVLLNQRYSDATFERILELNYLNKGVYFMEIYSGKSVSNMKLVIQ